MQAIHPNNKHVRGGTGIKTLIVLGVLGVAIYTGLQIFKVYDAYWTFEKDVETLVRFAFVNIPNDRQQQIVHQITEMLDSIHAQYDMKNVKVTVDEEAQKITVDVWYAQIINVPLFPNLKFFHVHIQSTNTVG